MSMQDEMSPVVCDWCNSPMQDIGVVETGMGRGRDRVYLCGRPGCGHEREVIMRPVAKEAELDQRGI